MSGTERMQEPDGMDHPAVIDAVAALRMLGSHVPAEHTAARHVRAAARIAANISKPDPRSNTMKSHLVSIGARAAAVAVFVVVVTAGAAYAGVLPTGIGSKVTQIAATVGLPDPVAAAEPPADQATDSENAAAGGDQSEDTTATTSETVETKAADESDAGKHTAVREIPEDVAEALAAVQAFRAAAKDWKNCVIDATRADNGAVDVCGVAPTPEEFGITPDLISTLPEKLQARVARFVEPIVAKLACIAVNAGDPEGMRECLAATGIDSTAKRGDEIRDRRDGGDGAKSDRARDRETVRDADERTGRADEREARREDQPPADRERQERKPAGAGAGSGGHGDV